MNPTNASAITLNKWEALKQWIESEVEAEAVRDEADISKAPNLQVYNEACGRCYALRHVLAHMALMELQELGKEKCI